MIIIPVGVDYQAARYPVVTFTLMGINAVVFAGQLAAFASGAAEHVFMNFGLVPAKTDVLGVDHFDVPARRLLAPDRKHDLPVSFRGMRRGYHGSG